MKCGCGGLLLLGTELKHSMVGRTSNMCFATITTLSDFRSDKTCFVSILLQPWASKLVNNESESLRARNGMQAEFGIQSSLFEGNDQVYVKNLGLGAVCGAFHIYR